jgi:hypothetical protein
MTTVIARPALPDVVAEAGCTRRDPAGWIASSFAKAVEDKSSLRSSQ